jgi:hypothetical protein
MYPIEMLFTANRAVQALVVSAITALQHQDRGRHRHRVRRQHRRRGRHLRADRRPLRVEVLQLLLYLHQLGSWWILM